MLPVLAAAVLLGPPQEACTQSQTEKRDEQIRRDLLEAVHGCLGAEARRGRVATMPEGEEHRHHYHDEPDSYEKIRHIELPPASTIMM